MRLDSVRIENVRAIASLVLRPDPSLTVLHGNNASGKTSVLKAIAVALGRVSRALSGKDAVDFDELDVREGALFAKVSVQTNDDLSWSAAGLSRDLPKKSRRSSGLEDSKALRERVEAIRDRINEGQDVALPVVAFYDTDRAVADLPQRRRDFREIFDRFDAYVDALTAKTSFKALFEWFYAKEGDELRLKRDEGDAASLPELDAVRRAIEGMIEGVHDPHIEINPLRFVVQMDRPHGGTEKLALNQLSGGYRIVLALVADLSRRMATANPHLPDPLQSEAIVLIDEVELHLHPEWQQRILVDLTRTFPNAQFIVSTHSPQVLSTVEPDRIVRLRVGQNGVVAESSTAPTFGAEAGDVLSAVMGVQERPKNRFSTALAEYLVLIETDSGETDQAKRLRDELERLSPHDPALGAADVSIRRRALLRDLAGR